MLRFYGLEIVGSGAIQIKQAPFFAERSENWLTTSNHNHLRITRILKSVRLLGLEDEALAFLDCLTELYHGESHRDSPRISRETFCFWHSAAKEGEASI